MGQGQSDIAMRLLRESSQNGDWLCLKNLHLVTAWLPVLEKVPCQLLCSVVPSNVIKVLVFVCKPCYELVILSPCSNCIQTSSELKPGFHFIFGFTIFF